MTIFPCLEVGEWIHLAAAGFPIIGIGGTRNPEVKMGGGVAGITGVPNQAKQLSGFNPDSRSNSSCDGREVRTIVAQPVVTDDGDRQTTAQGRVIVGRIPEVFIGYEIHHAICNGNKLGSNYGKNIGGGIAMAGGSLSKTGGRGWLKWKNMRE